MGYVRHAITKYPSFDGICEEPAQAKPSFDGICEAEILRES